MLKRTFASGIIFLIAVISLEAQSSYNFGLTQQQKILPESSAPEEILCRKKPIDTPGKLTLSGNREYVLSEGWRMTEGYKMISKPVLEKECDMSDWYNATVPGTVLTTLVEQGVYPDPYVGLNNMSIPDTLCRMDWWYRIEFDSPEISDHAKLIFNGINYRGQVWLNETFLGNVSGAFKRGTFEVGAILKKRGNILAVRILPPDNPGIPQEQTMEDFGNNGGVLCMDGPTFYASEGWDWMPGIRDRNIGIWQDVRLRYESSVSIENLMVITDLPLPDTTSAELSVRARLINNLDSPQEIIFHAETEGVNIQKKYSLGARETKEIMLTSEEFPDLHVQNPKLWWPNGYGDPYLYSMKAYATDSEGCRTEKDIRFGIREYTYELMAFFPDDGYARIHYSPTDVPDSSLANLFLNDDKHRKIYSDYPEAHLTVPELGNLPKTGFLDMDKESSNPHFALRVNGVRVFCKGGNWGMDDAMKRVSREKLEPYVRLHKEANFNMLRNWNGHSTEEALYDLCDEYGIMVWNDFFISTEWWNLRPSDSKLYLENTEDVIRRFSHHACIALWCSGNETYGPPIIEEGVKEQIAKFDGTRHYQGNSRYHNLRPSGPWCYMRDFNAYYNSIAEGFNTELGAPSVPTYETLCKFIKKEDLWPMNDVWAYHDALFNGWIGWREYCDDINAFGKEECKTAEEFCNRAQILNYNAHRVMFEAWNSKLWNNASGLLYWMSHPAWYSLVQQSYSHDYKPFGTFYGQKKACEPLHIQWELSGNVRLINASRNMETGMTAKFSVYSANGELLFNKEYVSDSEAGKTVLLDNVRLPKTVEKLLLARLTLKDSEGQTISVNDYWCGNGGYEYLPKGMIDMPSPELKVEVLNSSNSSWTATVTNAGQTIAPYIEMNIVDKDGKSVLPQYFSDSYFNLLPGETKTVTIECPSGKDVSVVAGSPIFEGEKTTTKIGVTSSGGYYAFDSSVSCVEEGADRILDMGARTIKMWLSDQSMRVNPYNTDWSRYKIENCVDVLKSEYYQKTISKDFTDIVLVTHTFNTKEKDTNVVWWDGMDGKEKVRVEQEMYDVASYLMKTYDGTGKTFILQNWEGDNMIGSNGWRYNQSLDKFYRPGYEGKMDEDDKEYRIRERGFLEWFKARQKGVDKARMEFGNKSDVTVRHALEVNFTYIDESDSPYPYPDSPILIKRIVPYTDCDLYSYSCWSATILGRAYTIRERLQQVYDSIGTTYIDPDTDKCYPRRALGKGQMHRIMLGEYGAPERYQLSDMGGWSPVLNEETARRQRKVIQIQTENALDFGVEYALFWEIYCNVPRVDTNPPVMINQKKGEQAVSNDQMQGSWLIRADGTFTDTYVYLKGLNSDTDIIRIDERLKDAVPIELKTACGSFELRTKVAGLPQYINSEQAESLLENIVAEYSENGTKFTPIELDCFVTTSSGQDATLVIINKGNLPPACRYLRFQSEAEMFRNPLLKTYPLNDNRLIRQ